MLVVLVVSSSCAPLDGYPCEKLEERRCDGPTKVAYCEPTSLGGKKWKAYDCPAGCGGDKCSSWKSVVVGDACPPADPGSWCDADGHLVVCSPNFTNDPVVARWTEGPCMACRKDVPIQQTGNCNASGACACQ